MLQCTPIQHSNNKKVKQTHRPRKPNKDPRNKPIHTQPSYAPQKRQKHTLKKGQPLQQVVLGKLGTHR
jgi:hypothetical protein